MARGSVAPIGPQYEDPARAVGFRRSFRRFDAPGMRDSEGARAVGPKRAAVVYSPTRDVKSGRVYQRSM